MYKEQYSDEAVAARNDIRQIAEGITTWPQVAVVDESGKQMMVAGIPLGLRKSDELLLQPDIFDVLTPNGILLAGVHNVVRIHQGGVYYLPRVKEDLSEADPEVYSGYKKLALSRLAAERAKEDGEIIKSAWLLASD